MSGAPVSGPDGAGPFHGIRRHRAHRGPRAGLVRAMAELVLPFTTGTGVDVTASSIGPQDPDRYLWTPRFTHGRDRAAHRAAVDGPLGGAP